ncbi:MAG: ParB/RepB/Spo0J family partition protein, partial [Thermofilaceae archaeon]
MEVKEILIESIEIPEERARATFTSEQDAELEASIKTHGFTVPILVAPLEDGKYMLIDGEHRINIAKRLGMSKVPAVVVEKDEKKITILNILANTARGTQNPVDIAKALKKARDAGASDDELAAATGHTVEWVRFYIMLNELPEHYLEKLRTGVLKVGHVREALRLNVPVEIDAALRSAVIHGWTVEDLKHYVDRRVVEVRNIYSKESVEEPPPPPTPAEAAEIVNYQTCMGCRRNVLRENIRMPAICEDCYTLLRYITDQLGDPTKAINTIYKALVFYNDAIQKSSQTHDFSQRPTLEEATPEKAG